MHPTLPPWFVSGNNRGQRVSLTVQQLRRLRQLQWASLALSDGIYRDKQLPRIIRLQNVPLLNDDIPIMWRVQDPPSSLPLPDFTMRKEQPAVPPAGGHSEGRQAAGGALLVVAVLALALVVRFATTCLCRTLQTFKRRQSEEWPTPTILATSHQHNVDDQSMNRPEGGDAEPTVLTVDLPPPYSDCANEPNGPTVPKYSDLEDPPPPYSACYVAFNPKDGPSVHFRNEPEVFLRNISLGNTYPSNNSQFIEVSESGTSNADKESNDADKLVNAGCSTNVNADSIVKIGDDEAESGESDRHSANDTSDSTACSVDMEPREINNVTLIRNGVMIV